MKRIAIFPGSFDPYTIGHHDLVLRSLELFDEIHIAIGINSNKKRAFESEYIISKLEKLYEKDVKVTISTYSKLTSEYADEIGAKYILRGLRNGTDLDYEYGIANINKTHNEELESVFLLSRPEHTAISSSIVRELHRFGKDVDQFLPFDL